MHPFSLQQTSRRVRILCVAIFIVGSLLPPYVPDAYVSSAPEDAPPPQFLFVEEGFLMKSSTIGEQGSRLAYSEGYVYTVREGDSLEALARQHHVTVDTIRWANDLGSDARLRPGQELLILPVDGVLHVVKKGQTLGVIAEIYDVSEEEIARQNQLEGSFIVAGQYLIIPGAKPLPGTTIVRETGEGPLRFVDALPGTGLRPPGTTGGGAVRPAQVAQAIPSVGILQMPCNKCTYTQGYHNGHYAVDIQTPGADRPIFAAEAGTVIRADYGWNGGYGNVIEIDHGNGVITLYAHNEELYVSVGDHVARGQHISKMGRTGLVFGKTGIHLHFEVHVNGVKKNPVLYLK